MFGLLICQGSRCPPLLVLERVPQTTSALPRRPTGAVVGVSPRGEGAWMTEQDEGEAKKILECVACWDDTWAPVRTETANGSNRVLADVVGLHCCRGRTCSPSHSTP